MSATLWYGAICNQCNSHFTRTPNCSRKWRTDLVALRTYSNFHPSFLILRFSVNWAFLRLQFYTIIIRFPILIKVFCSLRWLCYITPDPIPLCLPFWQMRGKHRRVSTTPYNFHIQIDQIGRNRRSVHEINKYDAEAMNCRSLEYLLCLLYVWGNSFVKSDALRTPVWMHSFATQSEHHSSFLQGN